MTERAQVILRYIGITLDQKVRVTVRCSVAAPIHL